MLYLYCPGQQELHSCCELVSETLVVVTCGELLGMYSGGTLKGEYFVLQLIHLRFLFVFALKIIRNSKARRNIS